MVHFEELRKGMVLKEKNPKLSYFYIVRSIGPKSVKVLFIAFVGSPNLKNGKIKLSTKAEVQNRLVKKDDWEYGDSGDTPNLWDPADDKMPTTEVDLKNLFKWIFKYA